MYTLKLSPEVADAIGLQDNEMAVLQGVRARAEKYLQDHPMAGVDPVVVQCIKDNQAREAERQRAEAALRARFK